MLSVIAGDNSTIDSLAGAVAVAGVGAAAASAAVRRLGLFQLPGRRSRRSRRTTDNNVVRAAIENVTGSIMASQIDVSATYTGQINNITVAGSAAVGAGRLKVALGGAVSDQHHPQHHRRPYLRLDSTSTPRPRAPTAWTSPPGTPRPFEALAGGVGIAVGTGSRWARRRGIGGRQRDRKHHRSLRGQLARERRGRCQLDGHVDADDQGPDDRCRRRRDCRQAGGIAGSGAGAGSGDTVQNMVAAYINNSSVTSNARRDYRERHRQPDHRDHRRSPGGGGGRRFRRCCGGSVGISVAINDVQDNVQAYINNSMVSADRP